MSSLIERDKKIMWHPFTQEKTVGPITAIKKAKGSYVYDEQGNAYLDCISSWWVNLHGHAHPDIVQSIHEQAQTLEHIIFAKFTHEPAVELCEQLMPLLPNTLNKFFFSDNGATSTEIALKMAYQYWYNNNHPEKKLFLSFEGGYHGDTFGAMSVGSSGFHDTFSNLFFKTILLPYPETWRKDKEVESKEAHALSVLETYLAKYQHNIAALIIEPLVQAACGMRICRPQFFKSVVERVRNAGILIIFDEVMTGFGRTGTYFALEQIGSTPDLLCLSKGLTGGFLPLALTIATEKIYNAFLHDEWKYALAHGHSYTANPIGCAAALASLRLLKQESTKQAIQAIHQAHIEGIAYLEKSCPYIKNTRVLGTISAFELNDPSIIKKIEPYFLEEGLLIRPLFNVIYLVPPYSTTTDEIKNIYKKISTILHRLYS